MSIDHIARYDTCLTKHVIFFAAQHIIYVYIYICLYTHTRADSIYMYICIYIYIFMYTYIYIYVYIYVYNYNCGHFTLPVYDICVLYTSTVDDAYPINCPFLLISPSTRQWRWFWSWRLMGKMWPRRCAAWWSVAVEINIGMEEYDLGRSCLRLNHLFIYLF